MIQLPISEILFTVITYLFFQLTESMNRLQTERSNLESEYEQLRNKQEALGQWESQLSEIIQWVSDEKDARAYLQALATKMTEELEYLKHTGKDIVKFHPFGPSLIKRKNFLNLHKKITERFCLNFTNDLIAKL